MQYQDSLGPHSGYESVHASAADSRSPRVCGTFTHNAPASDCVGTDHQDLLHRIEGATALQDHNCLFLRRLNMQEGSIRYFHQPLRLPQGGSELVTPTFRQVSSQTEIDNDSSTEEDDDNDDDGDMLVTVDEHDYDRETIDDGTPKTAEEICAEKRKQKRFRYLQAGRLGNPSSLFFCLDSRIIKPAFSKVNSLVRLTPMQHSASDCRKDPRSQSSTGPSLVSKQVRL